MRQTLKRMTDHTASRHRRPGGKAAALAGQVLPHPAGPGSGLASRLPLRKDGHAARHSASHLIPASRLPMTHLPRHTAEDMQVRNLFPQHAGQRHPSGRAGRAPFGQVPAPARTRADPRTPGPSESCGDHAWGTASALGHWGALVKNAVRRFLPGVGCHPLLVPG